MAQSRSNFVKAVTASTTETQAGSLTALLQGDISVVTTGSNDAVGIPKDLPKGTIMWIVNSSASAGYIWPPTGGNINAAGVDTAVELPVSTITVVICTASGTSSTYTACKLATL